MRRFATILGLTLGLCVAIAAPASAGVLFQYGSETTAPSSSISGTVTVFPGAAGSYVIEVVGADGAQRFKSPLLSGTTNVVASAVPLRIGDHVRLLDSVGATLAEDTFRGPLLNADACIGTSTFTGSATASPRFSLNHSTPEPVATYDAAAGSFSHTLGAPLNAGDVLVVSAEWTGAGTSSLATEAFTAGAACPPPAEPTLPPSPEGPATHSTLSIVYGPARSSWADGSAPAKVTLTMGPEMNLPGFFYLIAGQTTSDFFRYRPGQQISVSTPNLGSSSPIKVLHALRGSLLFGYAPALGPTLNLGGCPGSRVVSGFYPPPGSIAPAIAADLNGQPALMTVDGSAFRAGLPKPLAAGDTLTITEDHTFSGELSGAFDWPGELVYHGAYTLEPSPLPAALVCATNVPAELSNATQVVFMSVTQTVTKTTTGKSGAGGGWPLDVTAPASGTLSLGMLFGPYASGASAARRQRTRVAARRIKIASARVKAKRGGQRLRFKLKLTKAGRKLLRSTRKSLRVRLRITFDPTAKGLPTTTKTKTLVLRHKRVVPRR